MYLQCKLMWKYHLLDTYQKWKQKDYFLAQRVKAITLLLCIYRFFKGRLLAGREHVIIQILKCANEGAVGSQNINIFRIKVKCPPFN